MTLTVTSVKSEKSNYDKYEIVVKTLNRESGQFETVWTMSKHEPFEAKIEVDQLVKLD